MDNYTDNRQKEILWELLANPAEGGHAYKPALTQLVQDYPQSGILQVMLARADYSRDASRTAVYFNSRTLYKIINNPGGLVAVNPDSISYTPVNRTVNHIPGAVTETGGNDSTGNEFHQPVTDNAVSLLNEPYQEYITEVPPARTEDQQPYILSEPADETVVAETAGTVPEPLNEYQREQISKPLTETTPEEQPPAKASYEHFLFGAGIPAYDTDKQIPDGTGEISSLSVPDKQPEKEYFRQDIDDEIYDEIVGIEDIGFGSVNSFSEWTVQFEAPAPENIEAPHVEPQQIAQNDEELPVPENSAPVQENIGVPDIQEPIAASAIALQEPVADNQDLSRYHDDTLPYSFMWWLNKTRKEHAGSFQPYAVNRASANRKNTTDALLQQYNENIFSQTSINSIAAGDNLPPIQFDHNRKEDIIIERFIHTEPQIKPLAADKLDNENKARQSAEDHHELVTETLARIYTDQMLYPKAIATYQKLISKFPEKNAYFAAQIKELQKRTS